MSIPDGLVEYMAKRRQDRAESLEHALAHLTPRELSLVREAAVMGYVQGVRATGVQVKIPLDSEIVALVVGDASSFADLYPTLAGLHGRD